MLTYFEPYSSHPLIDSVNFSREKWQEYLSFRTDAYAFQFDKKGQIKRINSFQSFEIKTFDKYLNLIQDFADKSNFRRFFKEHQSYYKNVKKEYEKINMIPEIQDFLTSEFGNYFSETKYSIVLSAFVGAQNLHRDIDSIHTADFVPVDEQILQGNNNLDNYKKSIQIHGLFTEMNHGYINPITDNFSELLKEKFKENIWDDSSGYAGYKTAVFNEYMTWAVYDIFNTKYFPDIANEVNLYWHFQNDNRGFPYSYYFAQNFKQLYLKKQQNETIKDIYPQIIKWCGTQEELTKPTLISPIDSFIATKEVQEFNFKFSEPLKRMKEFDVLIESPERIIDTIRINNQHNLKWSDDNQSISFTLNIPEIPIFYVTFNWWGTTIPLYNEKGILIKSNSYVKVLNRSMLMKKGD